MKIKGKVLITGGCGFIGSNLVNKLTQQGLNVTVLDIELNPRSIFYLSKLKRKAKLHLIDIRNREKTIKIIKKCNPTYIIHLAAQPLVENAYSNPYDTFNTNIMGTVNILDAVRETKSIKGVIVASSDKAYGKTTKAYTENNPLKGDHPYDVSKSCEDLIAQTYIKTYKLPIVITRFGNVFGEGDFHFGRIIPDICKSVATKKRLLIRSNGGYVRDYIYVDDVVEGYIFLLKHINRVKGKAFNFSSKNTLSVIQLIKLAEKTLKVKIPIKILNIARNEIPYQHLNDKKVRRLGWETNHSVENTLKKIYIWYKDYLFSSS